MCSFSPTKILRDLPPFGRTWARSERRSVFLESLTRWTRRDSRVSGLNLPPVRSFERSVESFERAFSMPLESWEKSKGSSIGPEEVVASSSRSARVFFLWRKGDWEN